MKTEVKGGCEVPARRAVVFIFVDCARRRALLERRFNFGRHGEQLVFPGGGVEIDESVEQAFRRETGEELGVVPMEYAPLNEGRDPIITETGIMITPYIVTGWIGEVPSTILDQGNPVEWVSLEEVGDMPMESVRRMGGMVREHLEMERV